jgi:hypothetical protein
MKRFLLSAVMVGVAGLFVGCGDETKPAGTTTPGEPAKSPGGSPAPGAPGEAGKPAAPK